MVFFLHFPRCNERYGGDDNNASPMIGAKRFPVQSSAGSMHNKYVEKENKGKLKISSTFAFPTIEEELLCACSVLGKNVPVYTKRRRRKKEANTNIVIECYCDVHATRVCVGRFPTTAVRPTPSRVTQMRK